MSRASLTVVLLLAACEGEKEPTKPVAPAKLPAIQPEQPVLTVKAPPGQLVQTLDGLWLKAAFGTEKEPVLIKDGPASIAELGFVKSWVEHPPCAQSLEVKSLGLEGGERWIDRVQVRCGERWNAELFFDLTEVVQRQIESLRGADNPRLMLGLDPGPPSREPMPD